MNPASGPWIALAVLASLIQFILIVTAVLALRRMASAQEEAARHLERLVEVVSRTNPSTGL
jgi:hypothetical protein